MFYLALVMAQDEKGLAENGEMSRPFIEPNTHSFVVKIWLEETPEETAHPVWRGHITHVASGQRRYVANLSEILVFVVPYLAGLGIQTPLLERICLWLNRRK